MRPKDTKRTTALTLLFLVVTLQLFAIYDQIIMDRITVVGHPVWMSQIPGEQANRVDSAKALFFAVFDSSTILKNP